MAVLLFFTDGEGKPVSPLAWRGIDVFPVLSWCHLPPKRRRVLLPRTSWHLTNQILFPVCCWGKVTFGGGGLCLPLSSALIHLSLSISLSISTLLNVYLLFNSCPGPLEAPAFPGHFVRCNLFKFESPKWLNDILLQLLDFLIQVKEKLPLTNLTQIFSETYGLIAHFIPPRVFASLGQ